MSSEEAEHREGDLAKESDDEDLSALMGLCSTKDEGEKKPESVNGTALAYDDMMTKHKCDWIADYPENPARITQPFARCQQLGLIDRCQRLKLRYATEDLIGLQHSEELVELAKASAGMSLEQLKELFTKYDSFYCNNSSFECALASLGSTIETMEQVIQEKVRNGFAMVRPPGHHAMYNEFCGYCLFNNVAIAAKHALDVYKLDRILIVDWDVHHGQGTQYAFYDDPRVMYFSIHRYEFGTFWPNLRESDYDHTGTRKGKGYNINVPLNKIGMTDSDFFAIFHQLLLPLAYQFRPQLVLVSSGYDAALGCPEFRPQLIIVSSGFDAAIGDQKGEMRVSPAAYAHFIHMLGSLCQGRVVNVLEGGYCLKSLSEGCALTLRSLLGDPCPLLPPMDEPSDSITETILNVIKVLRDCWSCFQCQDDLKEGQLCPFEAVNVMPPKSGVEFVTDENKPDKYDNDDAYPVLGKEETARLDKEIDMLIAATSLTFAPHRTCLVFDADMRAHRNITFKGHPERPDRISRIYNKHVEWGLFKRCLPVNSRLATEEELAQVHSVKYIEEVKSTAEMNQRALDSDNKWRFQSIYLCKDSYRCARLSCGSVLSVVETVLEGKAQNGVAIVRPPGHHAECDSAMGFCFFNNVAVAVKLAQQKYGVKKILILDWDVHHGNGTQHQFEDDPSVLFISLHRYDVGSFYPGGLDGHHEHVGSGKGEGFNVNIPWSWCSMGDSEYITAFHQIVMPIAYQFAPELVLVSAGFDAARGDPLGGFDITPSGYGHMTHMLSGLANGRVVLMLEGGYNLYSISDSMATCTSVLLGDQCPTVPAPKPCNPAVWTIMEVLETQKKYWSSLKFKVGIPAATKVKKEQEVKPDESGDTEDGQSKERTSSDVTEPEKELKTEQNWSHEESGDLSQKMSELSVQAAEGVAEQEQDSASSPGQAGGGSGAPPGAAQDDDVRGGSEGGESSSGGAGADAGDVAGGGEEELGACGGSSSRPLTVMDVLKQQNFEQMFAVQPLPWCKHLETVEPMGRRSLDTTDPCDVCGDQSENWVCLVCYKVYCSRFVNEHMLFHGIEENHLMVLSYADLSVWCYGCDHYIDNQIIYPMKRSAHRSKFGEDLP